MKALTFGLLVFSMILTASDAYGARKKAPPSGDEPVVYDDAIVEYHKNMTVLDDYILRRVICRLSSQAFEPGALAKAMGEDLNVVEARINTLKKWGLVRMRKTDWGAEIVEPIPGEGAKTLKKWEDQYCVNGESCDSVH
jgi:hypothetical protein